MNDRMQVIETDADAVMLDLLREVYSGRIDALQAMLVSAADSEHIGPIIIKVTELGYPARVEVLWW